MGPEQSGRAPPRAGADDDTVGCQWLTWPEGAGRVRAELWAAIPAGFAHVAIDTGPIRALGATEAADVIAWGSARPMTLSRRGDVGELHTATVTVADVTVASRDNPSDVVAPYLASTGYASR